MKLSELAPFVGIKGRELKARVNKLGYDLKLPDYITSMQATELLAKVSPKRIQFIFKDDGYEGIPELTLIGNVTMKDWMKCQIKFRQIMRLWRRQFADAAAQQPPTVQQDEGDSNDRGNDGTSSGADAGGDGADPGVVGLGRAGSDGPDGYSDTSDSRESEPTKRDGPEHNAEPAATAAIPEPSGAGAGSESGD